jgi:FkbM family methyltransferase
MVTVMLAVFESQIDRVRRSLDRLERGSLPGSMRSAVRLVRRLGRFVISGARRALDSKLIRREVFYPIRNLILRDKPLTILAGGQSFVLSPRGAVPLGIWSGLWFERRELDFVVSALQPGMTFVDVGANVGFFSIPAAKKLKTGTVLAFEPCRWTYDRLLENVRLNGVTNLLAFHSALGDYEGKATMHVNVAGRDGLNTLGRPTHEDSRVVGTETVPMATLDDYLRKRSIYSVDVMKIDVEGAELFVLRGATSLLKRADAPLILYEGGFLSKGFDYHPVEQMWLLEKYGYCLFVIDPQTGRISRPDHGRAYDAMVIAVKSTHPAYITVKERAR